MKHFVEKGVPVYTEVEIGYRYAKHFRYGAVTGTNGRTTVTSLLYEMLKAQGNALAIPAISASRSASRCMRMKRKRWMWPSS